jgi:hypothetical protein
MTAEELIDAPGSVFPCDLAGYAAAAAALDLMEHWATADEPLPHEMRQADVKDVIRVLEAWLTQIGEEQI